MQDWVKRKNGTFFLFIIVNTQSGFLAATAELACPGLTCRGHMSATVFHLFLKITTSASLKRNGDQSGVGISEAKNRPAFRPQLCVS